MQLPRGMGWWAEDALGTHPSPVREPRLSSACGMLAESQAGKSGGVWGSLPESGSLGVSMVRDVVAGMI